MSSKKPTFYNLVKVQLHQTSYFISLFHFLIYFYLFFSQLPKYLPFPFSYSFYLCSRCIFPPSPPLPLSFTFSISPKLPDISPSATVIARSRQIKPRFSLRREPPLIPQFWSPCAVEDHCNSNRPSPTPLIPQFWSTCVVEDHHNSNQPSPTSQHRVPVKYLKIGRMGVGFAALPLAG